MAKRRDKLSSYPREQRKGSDDVLPKDETRPSRAATDTAVRHQVYLERVGSGMTADVMVYAEKLVNITAASIAALDSELADLDADELAAIIESLRTEQVDAMTAALDTLTAQLAELADYEGVFSARSLAARVRGVKIRSIKAGAAYEAALAQPIPATGSLLEDFTKGWSENQIKAVNGLVGRAYINGWTNQQAIQALRGTKKLGHADGIMPQIGRNAEAVVRTSIQHVANTARNETWARNSDVVVGYMIVATLDSNTTQVCRSLDHKTFELGKGPQSPLHIRCRSTTVAKVDPAFDFLDEGRTRSAENGPVSAKQSYYDWLKGQPAEFQNDAIGPTRAKLLRDGGLTSEEFARLNLNRRFEPMTLEEMRKAEPRAFERAGL